MKNSIPFHWKQSLTKDFVGDPRVKYQISVHEEKLDILNSTPQKWYRAIVRTRKQEIKHKEIWQQELPNLQDPPPQIEWEDNYIIPFSTTRETKLHSSSIGYFTGL